MKNRCRPRLAGESIAKPNLCVCIGKLPLRVDAPRLNCIIVVEGILAANGQQLRKRRLYVVRLIDCADLASM